MTGEAAGSGLPGGHADHGDTHLLGADVVAAWCDLVGDRNPLHLDPAWAAGTPFGGTVVPGHLLAALVCDSQARAGGTDALSVRFRAPVPVGARVRLACPGTGPPALDVPGADVPEHRSPVSVDVLDRKDPA